MSRLPVISFCVLVVATVCAFFISQHLKVTTPLLDGFPRPFPAVINPLSGVTCGPSGERVNHRLMHISFYLLHRSDNVDVFITDSQGQVVDTLATDRYMRGGAHPVRSAFTWNGRESDGSFAPDGLYYVKVALLHQGRTVVISDPQSGPVPVRVKTHAPTPRVTAVSPQLTAAPGTVQIRYTANGIRVVTIRIYRTDLPGEPRLVKSFLARGGSAVWDGRINQQPALPGVYLVGLEATDAACNTGRFPVAFPVAAGETPHAGVTVRYLAAQPPIGAVSPGRRATVLVDSRTHSYTWSLSRFGAHRPAAHGTSHSYALPVPVPRGTAGLYRLALSWGPHTTTVPLVAAAPRPAKLLVVLPALTWWGLNPGDEDGDGIPDTLLDGSSVRLARPLANGLPAGIGPEAGLLEYLDSIHQAYQLTTDFAPGAGQVAGNPFAGYRAVVLAGDEEWITPQLAAALRSYVERGGHVLSLGIGSLLRTVRLSGDAAVDPTGPSVTDALGARPEPVVTGNSQLIGVIEDHLGIFSGTSGLFRGFTSYQPFAPVQPPAKLLSAAGATSTAPAVIGYQLGRGDVVDMGLPDLGSLLAHDVDAQQLISQALRVLTR